MNYVEKIRAKTLFYLKNKGGKIENIVIPEIPKTWEFFPNSEDLWQEVVYPDDVHITGCLYKGGLNPNKPSVFYGHRHHNHSEHFTVVNKTGVAVIYTETYKKELRCGDSIFFQKGEPHLVEFLTPTTLAIIWKPKMDGYSAEFLSDKE